ncbi:MAG: glycosyltransferase [Methanobacteriaceae archaeon]|nr:glycosyltransferase [Methanobacteriaceae archaeon]
MKILQVIPYFAFEKGGDVNVCYNISKQLAKKGHKITILTTTLDYNPENTNTIPNLEMITIPYLFNLSLFIYSPKMKNWIKKHIKEYDIIHLHEFRSYQNNIITKQAQKEKIPYILQPHASTPQHINKKYLKQIYDKIYGNKIIQNATKTIAVSKSEEYYDNQFGSKDTLLLYNGMNIKEYENILHGFKKQFNITKPYLLYLGRLDKLKGIDIIIKSYKQVQKQYPDYKLVIAGKINSYKEKLDKIIIDEKINKENIIFTDYLTETQKKQAYNEAELFLNPVKYMGGVSITTLESILANTPVIATKESGEILILSNSGIIVEYGNIKQLTEKIIWAIENPKKTQKQVQTGQKYIRENLSWKTVTDKLETIYEDAIKGETR